MSGEHASGESASGETSEPNCLVSCAEFTECTIKTCPGYDEPDQNLLMEECLSLCTPGLALIFDTIQGCAEKIRFANSVRGDFLEFCESSSDGFCETYVATCGSWLGTSPCEDHYNLSPAAGASFTEGAHRSCYEYHLGSAMRGLEVNNPDQVQRGCENAAGLSVCIDE